MHSTSENDWKTDWLYKLVLQYFKKAWAGVIPFGPPPSEFLITQCDEISEDTHLISKKVATNLAIS